MTSSRSQGLECYVEVAHSLIISTAKLSDLMQAAIFIISSQRRCLSDMFFSSKTLFGCRAQNWKRLMELTAKIRNIDLEVTTSPNSESRSRSGPGIQPSTQAREARKLR